jgi:hypothetical protein
VSWDRPSASAALAFVLEAATDGAVTVFETPPATFNAPALVVNYPSTVTKHTPAFAVDQAELTVTAAVGAADGDKLDALLDAATAAIETDPTLGGAVQHAKPVEWRTWRLLAVSGIDLLAADLALEIRM